MNQSQLHTILAYHNENVISRFTDMFDVSAQEADSIFAETKKFLYLCQLPEIFIPDELLIVDEMWHNFILFTKDYHIFCDTFFKRYFHHLPASKKEKELQLSKEKENPMLARDEFRQRLQILMNATYDHLGQDTLITWFQTYPTKYNRHTIKTLRK